MTSLARVNFSFLGALILIMLSAYFIAQNARSREIFKTIFWSVLLLCAIATILSDSYEYASVLLLSLGALALLFTVVNICTKNRPGYLFWSILLLVSCAFVVLEISLFPIRYGYKYAFESLRGDGRDSALLAIKNFKIAGGFLDADQNAAFLESIVNADNPTAIDIAVQYVSAGKKTISSKSLAVILLEKMNKSQDIDNGLRLLTAFRSELLDLFTNNIPGKNFIRNDGGGGGVFYESIDSNYEWLKNQPAAGDGKVVIYCSDELNNEQKIILELMHTLLPAAFQMTPGDNVAAVILVKHRRIYFGRYQLATTIHGYQRAASVELCALPDLRVIHDFGTVKDEELPHSISVRVGFEGPYYGRAPHHNEVMKLVKKAVDSLEQYLEPPSPR